MIEPVMAPLIFTDCPLCQNDGCEACAGSGEYEVCSQCLEAPTVRDGVDACACTIHTAATCEICETTVRATELCAYNVCMKCRTQAAEQLEREGDPEVLWALEYTDWLPAA